ncbi:DUF6313 family protein [Streptomyces endophytica]|uniref:DUF6313 family protein n=1 Tax=Streptomyces endophytica TaxID=2991496 RepID=A0ABY6P979_9ACTN|nr:DUF6313 family protein [Streptomyces endophytica]UZJ30364.1 DUF6313 family protein [Streptomyces endophytica]
MALALPPVRARGRVRRLWRSRKALAGLTQWVIDWGIPFAVGITLLSVFASRAASPSEVYRTFTLIDPPDHTLLWLASVIGWLAVPAVIGGVAGHVIATRIQSVKSISTSTLFQRRTWTARLRPPSRIDYLGNYFHGTLAEQAFVDAFVRIAHRNDWMKAQDHWEVIIRDTMSTQQFSKLDRHECLRQAQDTTRIHMRPAALIGLCVVCIARKP